MEQLRRAGLACSIVLCLVVGSAVSTTNTSTACYGSSTVGSCVSHRLRCSEGTSVFVVQALRFFDEDRTRNCPTQNNDCTNFGHCCTRGEGDCFKDYSEEDFEKFFTDWDCWQEEACDFEVSAYWSGLCGRLGTLIRSGYSEITYACVTGSEISNFQRNSVTEGQTVALQYSSDSSSEDDSTTWTCLVEAGDCSSLSAGVTMVMKKNEKNFNDTCTSFGVNSNNWLQCHSSKLRVRFLSNVTTPFTVTLRVYEENDSDDGWLVVYTTTTPSTTRPVMTSERTTTMATETGAEATMATTSETTSVETAARLGEGEDGAGGSTGAVVGGVVVAVLAVVALVLLVVFLLKRRGALPGPAMNFLANFRKSASSPGDGNPQPGASATGQRSDEAYVEIQEQMAGAHHPTPPADPATMAANQRHLGADYDHIGQSQPKPPSSDVTYGHLAQAGDVVVDDYDHVGRARDGSRDVINNPYDVAKPVGAAGEDASTDYDVTSAKGRRQPDVINSPYDSLKTEW